jgi:succinyl-CoA synthetase alpha subunit
MSILVNRETRLLVQGITGREGEFHAQRMVEYGTKVVGGVTPGRGGTEIAGIPVFDTVSEALKETKANASIIFVPARFAPDAIYETADAGIPLVVCITEGIPTLDMIEACAYLDRVGVRLIGPNCPGLISPGECKVGIMPEHIHTPGNVGVVSRSGTLTYEVVYELTRRGVGQSTVVGIGGDPILGTGFMDTLSLFQDDPHTDKIVLIGEIGGREEEEAAQYIASHMTKPTIAFVAGRTAPPEKRMGHAGAIISGGTGTAQEKIRALEKVGIPVASYPAEVADLIATI